jgi:hypothetical protein
MPQVKKVLPTILRMVLSINEEMPVNRTKLRLRNKQLLSWERQQIKAGKRLLNSILLFLRRLKSQLS